MGHVPKCIPWHQVGPKVVLFEVDQNEVQVQVKLAYWTQRLQGFGRSGWRLLRAFGLVKSVISIADIA